MSEENKIQENFYTKNLLHFYNVPLIHDKLKNFQKNRSVEEQSMYLKNILKLSDEDNENYLEELKNYEYEVIVETLYRTFSKDKYSISLEKFKELAVYLIEDSINESNISIENISSLIMNKLKAGIRTTPIIKHVYKRITNKKPEIIKIINELTKMNENYLYTIDNSNNKIIRDDVIQGTIDKYLSDQVKIDHYNQELSALSEILGQQQDTQQNLPHEIDNLFKFIKKTIMIIRDPISTT